jgi:hypothetical protein
MHIDRAAVERVKSCMFLGMHINDNLKWSIHTDRVLKKASQCLLRASCRAGMVTAPSTTSGLSRG